MENKIYKAATHQKNSVGAVESFGLIFVVAVGVGGLGSGSSHLHITFRWLN